MVLRVLSFNFPLLPLFMNNTSHSKNDKKNTRCKLFFQHFSKDYDVLLLQEIWGMSHWSIGPFQSCLDLVCQMSRHQFAFQHFYESTSLQVVNSGLLILSKYPLINKKGKDFCSTSGFQSFIPRGILSCSVVISNHSQIDLFNTHFHAGCDESIINNTEIKAGEVHKQQTKELSDYMQLNRYSKDYILAGDFNICSISNLHGSSCTFKEFESILNLKEKSLMSLFLPGHYTYPVPLQEKSVIKNDLVNQKCKNLPQCLDHVFSSLDVQTCETKSFFCNGQYLSDHCAISLIFRLST